MKSRLKLSLDLIEKFNVPVPRYTSYPMVPHWSNEYKIQDHVHHLRKASESNQPLSLYVHIPFCHRICFFCACNVKITTRPELPKKYLETLETEANIVANHLDNRRTLSQLHIGGGTPTHLTPKQLKSLMTAIKDKFSLTKNAELSIEIHPSVTTTDHLKILADEGFNRISMGVQDFDSEVQFKINRHQTYEETVHIISEARDLNFKSVNIDLIYGLPYQTIEGFRDTINKIKDIRPDRLAIYSYAHLPKQIKHQSIFPDDTIPKGREKLQLFLLAREMLIDYEYELIGFDHFCLPSDDLWNAYQNHSLRRNFMGYTTQAGTDLVSLGFSAISDVAGSYAQNSKNLNEYTKLIETHGLATVRGLKLSQEDLICREAIITWMCQNTFNPKHVKQKYTNNTVEPLINKIVANLEQWEAIGLAMSNSEGDWKATELGQIFARIVATSFDQYLPKKGLEPLYSNAI